MNTKETGLILTPDRNTWSREYLEDRLMCFKALRTRPRALPDDVTSGRGLELWMLVRAVNSRRLLFIKLLTQLGRSDSGDRERYCRLDTR